MPKPDAAPRPDGAGVPGPSPMAVIQLLAAMRAIGLDADAICAETGLVQDSLADRVTNVSLAEVAPLWRKAAERFGRETIGLHVGSSLPGGHILDYLALASPTLREALGQVTRYYPLIVRYANWVMRPRGEDGLTLVEHVAKLESGTLPAQLREMAAATITARIRTWSGSPPLEVWFTHAPLGPADEYRKALGCEARFGRDRTGVVLDDAMLDTSGARSDPALASLLQAHADLLLARVPPDATLAQQVRGAVIAELRDGEPDVERIARRLATSARSLQRRLQEEGASFRGVVDATRLELAQLYLGEKNLSITDVAYLLGYSESAAFIRAFKRWTGDTPSAAKLRYRRSST